MTNQINARIEKHEASKALLNQNNPRESSVFQYHVDMIKSLKDALPKRKVKLHVAEDSLCESCE